MMTWLKKWRGPITWFQIFFFIAATTVSVCAQPPPILPPGTDLGAAPVTPPPARAPQPSAPAPSQEPTGLVAPPGSADKLILLNFKDSPVDQVLEFVADLVGRTLIKAPGVGGTITLKSQTKLTVPEALQAIESVLSMNNVTLVPMGSKFLKVVQTAQARTEGMPLRTKAPERKFNEDDQLVSQVVALKYVEIAEAQPILATLIHGYGKIQPLERTNSLLITDTAGNINRILEILEYIDQPAESQVETRIYELRFAEAPQVASKLNELIADSQAKEEKPRVETAASAPPPPQSPPGVIRAAVIRPGGEGGGTGGETAAAMAERGIIRGKVKIIADDRTNIMFVISRPENFAFFDKIVAVLDRPIEPEIGVRVVPLEFAKAEDVASILNEFIGAASAEKKTGSTAAGADGQGDAGGSRRLDEVLRQTQARLEQAQQQIQQNNPESPKGTIGRLSPNTKILADKRTNSLLLMGRKSDLDALALVLDSVDIMLAQVLLETVIIEVTLGDTVETGFSWLQRSITAYNERRVGPGGGATVRTPVFSFGGSSTPRDGTFIAGDAISRANSGSTIGSLSYFSTIEDLNLDMIIRLAAGSNDAKVLSTPVVLTTDNTEAKIVAAEQRPVVTSTSLQTTGQQTQNFEYRNIGITITITPRINPSGFVMMEISQNADEVLSETQINNTTVPIIGKREISAQVGVQSRQTVVLGGLVRTDNSKTRTKVPVLGDIPLLGYFFRSDSKKRNRSELLVLVTPYVLKTPKEALDETKRLYNNSRTADAAWHTGWSDSVLPRARAEELKRTRAAYFPPMSESEKDTLAKRFSTWKQEKPIAAPPAKDEPSGEAAPAKAESAEPTATNAAEPEVERAATLDVTLPQPQRAIQRVETPFEGPDPDAQNPDAPVAR